MGSTLEVLGHQFLGNSLPRQGVSRIFFNWVETHQIGMEFAPIFQLVVVVISFFRGSGSNNFGSVTRFSLKAGGKCLSCVYASGLSFLCSRPGNVNLWWILVGILPQNGRKNSG